MDFLAAGAQSPLPDLGRELMELFDRHRGTEAQRDDITALAFEIHPRSAP